MRSYRVSKAQSKMRILKIFEKVENCVGVCVDNTSFKFLLINS